MTLGAMVLEAVKMARDLRAKGLSKADAWKGLEALLRERWMKPVGRWEPWRICEGCEDYGLAISSCPGDRTCGRYKPHLAHEFGRPCHCAKGNRFREKPKPGPEDFSGAGKQPVRQPRRFGR